MNTFDQSSLWLSQPPSWPRQSSSSPHQWVPKACCSPCHPFCLKFPPPWSSWWHFQTKLHSMHSAAIVFMPVNSTLHWHRSQCLPETLPCTNWTSLIPALNELLSSSLLSSDQCFWHKGIMLQVTYLADKEVKMLPGSTLMLWWHRSLSQHRYRALNYFLMPPHNTFTWHD